MKEEICNRIKEIRISLGMNKNEFANFLEITPQYLGSVENGENCLSVEKIIFLAQKANVSTDFILLGKKALVDDKMIQNVLDINVEQLNDCYCLINGIIDLIKKSR